MLEEDTLIEQYMADTNDDEGAIKFIKSPECTLEIVNYEDGDGWTALNLAARLNRYEVVKALIEKGADVNQINSNYSYNALMFCIIDGSSSDEDEEQYKTAKLLIDSGTNLNFEDRFSAFSQACEMAKIEILKLILQHPSINIGFIDEENKTGLDYLNEDNNVEGLSLVNAYVMNNKLDKELKEEKKNVSNKVKM
jgi:ankyrin repeat protein